MINYSISLFVAFKVCYSVASLGWGNTKFSELDARKSEDYLEGCYHH
ncbi:MAG: hypothetical protein SCAL_001167 [Candidatus Syntrophoarchaeum caldarius]|uniref:Uncharacterized protein n=1 Tax=Candidatus Syntropharchaeum caldarium TaxID=1838285 RepID=A0A1F2PA13_9EURY|nr:MAG: hypothetical protein SCAL_001167 [Candidatus Syntrophoarchaeum caldarius]